MAHKYQSATLSVAFTLYTTLHKSVLRATILHWTHTAKSLANFRTERTKLKNQNLQKIKLEMSKIILYKSQNPQIELLIRSLLSSNR
jgi:hypothetical protein